MVRKFCAIGLCLLFVSLGLAHGNQPGKAELKVTGGKVVIDFVAPELKGRDINELIKQPGANPWRLGADKATTFETPVALQFGEGKVAAGKYVLRALLDDQNQWWLQLVDDSKAVVAKAPLKKSVASKAAEHLAINLDGKPEAANVKIQWGTQVLEGNFAVAK